MHIAASNDSFPNPSSLTDSSTLFVTTRSAVAQVGGAHRPAADAVDAPGGPLPLKKPGAWPDVPVRADPSGIPIYVRLPCTIEFVNVPPAVLRGQLTAVPDGPAGSKLAIVPPLGARSAVDVLTDNAFADESASLGAAGNNSSAEAGTAASETPAERIARVNARLAGHGTLLDPYAVSEGPLFVLAPITFGFPGVPADTAQFQIANPSASTAAPAGPAPAVAAPRGVHRDDYAAAPRSGFFDMWEAADRHVPFPFLYRWSARPATDDQPALKLQQLSRMDFVYRITNDFSAQLTGQRGAFAPAIIHRESLAFRLIPVQGRQGLLTPEQAELAVEKHLQQRTPGGEPSPEAPRAWSWASLVFEHPFAAGQTEPLYRFRKAGDHHEFTVGARSGQVRGDVVRGADSSVSDPGLHPSR